MQAKSQAGSSQCTDVLVTTKTRMMPMSRNAAVNDCLTADNVASLGEIN